MFLNNKNKKSAFGPKKANHGLQSASVKALELNKDKNDNFYLSIILDCDTGEFTHRIFRPVKSDYATINEPAIETKDSVFWENSDKLADLLARFVLLFDTTTSTEEGEINSFFLAYDEFLGNLNKGLKVKVTEKNVASFGFIKASRKVTKQSRAGNSYDSFEKRIVGTAPNSFYEDGNDPKYAYEQYIGESIPDYENIDYWNSLFQFIFNYLVDLKNQGQLDNKFLIKLIRVKSYEFEKDSDGKFIKIDDKKVVKATYYNVGVPASTMWFKNPKDNFQLKINSAEQKVIDEYLSNLNALNVSDNVEVVDNTDKNSDDLPF